MNRKIITFIFSILIIDGWGYMIAQVKPVEPARALPANVKFGITERIREEAYDNIIDANKDRLDRNNYIRYRTNLWAQYNFTPDVLMYGMVTNEFRNYFHQEPVKKAFTKDEIIFDNLYFQIKPNKNNPFGMILGRQNLMYGEGFILMEGGPGDGSRTIYFNAAKVSYVKGATTVDLLGIVNPRIDEYFPTIEDMDKVLIERHEKAAGVYLTSKAVPDHQVEAYVIRKLEETSPHTNLNTVGARFSRAMKNKVAFAAEWAYQNGSRGAIKKTGIGGYTYASLMLAPQYQPTLTGGVIYLSGDDPKTAKDEGWDPLFSRWPKWSELYLYTLMNERVYGVGKPVGYWTNFIAPYLKFSVKPHKMVTVDFYNYFMNSQYARYLTATTLSGKKRGNEFQIIMNLAVTKALTAHVMYKYFSPGNYYAAPRSAGYFFRWQFQYAFVY